MALTTATNPHENSSSTMSLNVEFNFSSQGDEINSMRNLEENSDNVNSASDNIDNSNSTEMKKMMVSIMLMQVLKLKMKMT